LSITPLLPLRKEIQRMKNQLVLGAVLFIGITCENALLASAQPITLPEITVYGKAPRRAQKPINFVEIEPVTIYGNAPQRAQNSRGVVTLPETTIYSSNEYNACVREVDEQSSCGGDALKAGAAGTIGGLFTGDPAAAALGGLGGAVGKFLVCSPERLGKRQQCGEQYGFPPPSGDQTTYGGDTPYGDQRSWLY